MCHHRLSPGCCSELCQCFDILLVTASRRYSAILTPPLVQQVIASSFQRQTHEGIDLPDSHICAKHLCKSVEIQDIIILSRHCPDCSWQFIASAAPRCIGRGHSFLLLFSVGNCVPPQGRIKCTCGDIVTLFLPDLIWVGNLSAEPVVNSFLYCLAESRS